MKRFTLLAAAGLFSMSLSAQEAKEEPKEEGFVFTTVKELPITSIKNQNRAGTCWCYSSMAFLESELLRMGKGEYDLSEMYIVHQTYLDRADAAVRTHGDVSFSQGGSFYDVIYGMKKFGLVPEEEMRPGVMYGDTLSNHTELTAVSDAVVAAIAKGKHRSLQTDENRKPLWKKAIAAIHDIYLGECPEKFTYKGKEYTPQSFFESTGLNPDDYISLTSYTHHPFYEPFVLEIQDNWRWGQSYNLPIDELMEVFDNAINTGYTIAWGSDVSEQGFTRDGIAVMPDAEKVQDGSGWFLVDGILTVLLSIFLLCNQMFTMMTLPYILGMWLLFSGITKFVNSFDLRRFGVRGWGWVTAFGLLMAAAGFLSFMDPLAAAVTLSVLAGLFLMIQGVVSIVFGCLSGRFWM